MWIALAACKSEPSPDDSGTTPPPAERVLVVPHGGGLDLLDGDGRPPPPQ